MDIIERIMDLKLKWLEYKKRQTEKHLKEYNDEITATRKQKLKRRV